MKLKTTISLIISFLLMIDISYEFYLFTGNGYEFYKNNLIYIVMYVSLFIILSFSLLLIMHVFEKEKNLGKLIILFMIGIISLIYYIFTEYTISRTLSEILIICSFIILFFILIRELINKKRRL